MSSTTSLSKSPFPILQVVQKYIKTHPKGSNHWAVCPFHKDTSPSLSVSVEKNIFKCFSCNIAGDAIGFVMRIENCNYVTAIKKITSILNLNVEDYLNKEENEFRKIHELNSLISSTYHKFLFNKSSEQSLKYLTEERKLSIETIQKYQIGYSPKEDILSPVLDVYLKTNKVSWSEQEIRKTGIFNYSQYGEKRPYFQERIIFPIFNKDKQIIAFSGRSTGNQEPKYLNIKSNEIFSKKNAVFNIQNLEKEKPIYVFEGFIDLLSCQQFGFSNGVACMGGTMDINIFKILETFSKEIYLCLDNDEAGHNFAINLCKSLVQNGFKTKIVDLLNTKYKDIDEYLKNENEAAINVLKTPICCFEWYYKKLKIENITSFQTFLETCLDFLLSGGKYLRKKIDPEYAKKKIKYLFGLYKNLPEYDPKSYDELIDKKIKEYENLVIGSLINTNSYIEVPKKEISKTQDSQQITNPFFLLSIKYQNIIRYIEKNMNSFSENDSWYIEIPEKYSPNLKEVNLIFKTLKNLLNKEFNFSKEEENTLEVLSKYLEKSEKIKAIDDFYNKYYSFNQEYINALIDETRKNKKISPEDRWLRINELKDFYSQITKKASKFFLNSSFSKRI